MASNADIAEKDHLWMGTNKKKGNTSRAALIIIEKLMSSNNCPQCCNCRILN